MYGAFHLISPFPVHPELQGGRGEPLGSGQGWVSFPWLSPGSTWTFAWLGTLLALLPVRGEGRRAVVHGSALLEPTSHACRTIGQDAKG